MLVAGVSVIALSVFPSTATHALSLGPLDGIVHGLLGTNKDTAGETVKGQASGTQSAPTKQSTTPDRPAVTPQAAPASQSSVTSTTPTQSQSPVRLAQASVQPTPTASTDTPVAPVESTTSDTAPIVKQLASAQTRQTSAVVTYPSLRIDSDKRDQLYAIATSVVIVGLSLYGMTLVQLSQRNVVASRRPLYIK